MFREGDRNTRFFHKMANVHRRRDALLRIKINGQWFGEYNGFKEGVVNAFQNLLIENGDWRPSCDGLAFSELEENETAWLDMPF